MGRSTKEITDQKFMSVVEPVLDYLHIGGQKMIDLSFSYKLNIIFTNYGTETGVNTFMVTLLHFDNLIGNTAI